MKNTIKGCQSFQHTALWWILYFHWGWVVNAYTDMHAPQPLFPCVITCNWAQTPLPSFLHLFPFWLGELVSCFFYFPEVYPLFPSLPFFMILLSIFAVRLGWKRGVRRGGFTVAKQRLSWGFATARVKLVMPLRACGAWLSQPSSACIFHGPCASCEPLLWVKREVEWGEKRDRGRGVRWNIIWRAGNQRVGYFFSVFHRAQPE